MGESYGVGCGEVVCWWVAKGEWGEGHTWAALVGEPEAAPPTSPYMPTIAQTLNPRPALPCLNPSGALP